MENVPHPVINVYTYTKHTSGNCYQKRPLRACLHGDGESHPSCKRDQIKMRDYMERRVTPLKRVTSPTWGCTQALN